MFFESKNNFTTSFSIYMPCTQFSYFIALAGSSGNIILNELMINGYYCFVSKFNGKVNISPRVSYLAWVFIDSALMRMFCSIF